MSDTEYWQLKKPILLQKMETADNDYYWLGGYGFDTFTFSKEMKEKLFEPAVDIETKRQAIREKLCTIFSAPLVTDDGQFERIFHKELDEAVDVVLDIVGYKGEQ